MATVVPSVLESVLERCCVQVGKCESGVSFELESVRECFVQIGKWARVMSWLQVGRTDGFPPVELENLRGDGTQRDSSGRSKAPSAELRNGAVRLQVVDGGLAPSRRPHSHAGRHFNLKAPPAAAARGSASD